MAQAANADDTYALSRARVIRNEGVEDGGAAALEGSGVFTGDGGGDLEKKGFAPDGMGGHRAGGVVGRTVHCAKRAEGLFACEAFGAVTAGVVEVAEADVVASISEVSGCLYEDSWDGTMDYFFKW